MEKKILSSLEKNISGKQYYFAIEKLIKLFPASVMDSKTILVEFKKIYHVNTN